MERKQETKSSCDSCDGTGWSWPNLGVNCDVSAGPAIACIQSMASPASYYIQCLSCNRDGSKPHPDANRVSASELDNSSLYKRVMSYPLSYTVLARTDNYEEYTMEIVAKTDYQAQKAARVLCQDLELVLLACFEKD